MPKQYEAMRDKFKKEGLSDKAAGVLLRAGGPGTIIVTGDDEPVPVEFDTLKAVGKWVGEIRLNHKLQLGHLNERRLHHDP